MLTTRTDIPESAFPRSGSTRTLLQRDVPTRAFPRRGSTLRRRRDVPHTYLAGSTGWAVATEWLGRLAGAVAIVLMLMVLATIQKGLAVQGSADRIVDDFHTANDYFDERADLSAPKKVRKQLQDLRGVLVQLNGAAAADVHELSAVLPVVDRLLAAGEGDVRIAHQLRQIAELLSGSAGQLRGIALTADTTVNGVDAQLAEALDQVNQLNTELERTTRKLALLPATGDNS